MKPLLNTSLLAFFLFSTTTLIHAQEVLTIPVITKDNCMVLQTDKEGRPLINYFGKKLLHPKEYECIAAQYNLKDDNPLTYTRYKVTASIEPIPLKGLDPVKQYRIKEINLYPGTLAV